MKSKYIIYVSLFVSSKVAVSISNSISKKYPNSAVFVVDEYGNEVFLE